MNIKDLTTHNNILLVNRGNTAIKLAFEIVKQASDRKKILIPDQAGWLSYKDIPAKLGFEVVEVKTDNGLIDLKDLDIKSSSSAALICMGMPGYFAEDNIKQIASICHENNCLVIEDCTANIGLKDNSQFVDFSICSFGKWKPVNLGNGGMLTVKSDKYFSLVKNKGEFDEIEALQKKLDKLGTRFEKFLELNETVKNDLKEFEIIHKSKRGINVVVKFSSLTEKEKLIKYCETNGFNYVECPKYYKILCDAISIEIKRL